VIDFLRDAATVTVGILATIAISEAWEAFKRWRRDRRFEREHLNDYPAPPPKRRRR
jgi:hypothetical protein